MNILFHTQNSMCLLPNILDNAFYSLEPICKIDFLARQLLFLLPGLALLPLCIGLDGVWWSMPMSDTLATIVAIWMFFVQIKRLKAQHPLKH